MCAHLTPFQTMTVQETLTATLTAKETLLQTQTLTNFATVTDMVTQMQTVVVPTTHVSVWVSTQVIDNVSPFLIALEGAYR
jgi:hypothetical protein